MAVSLCLVAICVIGLSLSGGYSVYTLGTNKRELPIYSVDRNDNKISISFDCAWGDEYTRKILDALDFYKVKCTFFCVQFWTEKYPELVKEISARGHDVGTHSATHPKMSTLSKAKNENELKTSKKAIEDITGKTVELFRAPFGDYDDEVILTAKEQGLYTIQWDVDSLDWKDLSAEQIATRIISKTKSGSIILCHNNGLHTAEALPLIFTTLQQKGYVFVPISELIYKDNYEILPDGKQTPSEKT